MIKKILLAAAVATTSAVLLSGCVSNVSRTDNVIELSQNMEVKSIANWSESSLKQLQKDGWTIREQQRQALREDNLAIPQSFSASDKDGNCFVSYNVYVTNVLKPDATDDYNTRETAYNYADAFMPSNFKEGTRNISIKNTNDKLQMLELSFTYENKQSKPLTEEEAKALQSQNESSSTPYQPEYVVDGEINEVYLTRVTRATVDNPLYDYLSGAPSVNGVATEGSPQKKGNMVIEMKYACKKQPLDMKLWDKLVADAAINFDALPTPTGAPKQ